MKTKYIVINKEKGVFLGAYSGYAFFAKTDPVGIPKAFAFDTPDVAKLFIDTNMTRYANNTFYVPIETKSTYPSVSDIIKAGYGDYTYNMMDYLPMPSEAIH